MLLGHESALTPCFRVTGQDMDFQIKTCGAVVELGLDKTAALG